MFGYYGGYALVDLRKKKVTTNTIPEEVFHKYIGGSGLGAWLLTRYTDPTCAPLSSENTLIYTTGPFANTLVPTSGRHQITAKSPLTGTFGEADVGGNFGYRFRHSGFDALVITSISDTPVYLYVTNNCITIHDARELWGKDTFSTTEILKNKYGQKSEVSCIGPSGENLQLIASILHDGRDARMAGRGGLGAVMGSKNVKAVIVAAETSCNVDIYDAEALRTSARATAKEVAGKMADFGKYGTVGTLEGAEILGDVPVKHWQEGTYREGCENLSGIKWVIDGLITKRFFCKQCPIGCGRTVILRDGNPGGGPEYETTCMYGTNCLIDDYNSIFTANEIANRAGFDTITSGSTISMLMEAYERGYVTPDDLGGIVPEWGSSHALIQLLSEIAENSVIGRLLSQGSKKVAQTFHCEDLAMEVKGLEVPAHDPRAFSSLSLSYATANRGACHLQGMTYSFEKGLGFPEYDFEGGKMTRFDSSRKSELTVYTQHWMSICDSLKICKFSLFGGVTATKTAEWLSMVTGWKITWEELMQTGERIYNLKRMFNCKAGFSRKDDTLPLRLLNSPKGGGTENHLPPDLEQALDEYYAIRKWGADGFPTKEKLLELDILDNLEYV